MSVERHAGPVVAHGGARVGVAGGFLDVVEWYSGIDTGRGDERVTQRVRSDSLVDPGPACDPSHDPRRAVPVESSAGTVAEDRPFAALTDREIDRARGIVTVLPPLRWMTRVR